MSISSTFGQNLNNRAEILPDSVLINILEKIESNRNPNFVLGLFSDSLQIAKCQNDSLKSRAYYHMGRAYGQLGKFDQSLEALSRGLEVSADLPD
ncbi:tetratricopeptide repeat protein, partial [Reichenbachiella sp.]